MTRSKDERLLWDINKIEIPREPFGEGAEAAVEQSRNPDTPGERDEGHGKARKEGSKSAGKTSARKPRTAKAPPFHKHVATLMGRKSQSVLKDLRLAEQIGEAGLIKLSQRQDLTEGDLVVLAKTKDVRVREKAVDHLAAGASMGDAMSWATAPDNATFGYGGGVVRPKPDEELTDDEWFERHCGGVSPALKNAPAYKRDALSYRRTMEDLRQMGRAVRPEVRARRNDKLLNGGYNSLLYRMAQVSHPKHWLACGPCGGRGSVNGQQCQSCYGAGFKIQFEPLKK